MGVDKEELEATRRLKVKNKCEFCKEPKEYKSENFDMRLIGNKLILGNTCSEGCGYERTRFNINYCMFCGRKLV